MDMERFDEIEYLAERKRVKVGAGAQMGAVVQRLATQGRTLAGGFEPRRGVGEALAGEFGMTVRCVWSLLQDSADLVAGCTACSSISLSRRKSSWPTAQSCKRVEQNIQIFSG